ncbi:hypothetical protein Tco_1298262 [Tanacetum coccineum]
MNEAKKAYANMILNVTKEAAARVMVSERKAARLEAEMKRSKDEVVFMLMRLKQMMDAKVVFFHYSDQPFPQQQHSDTFASDMSLGKRIPSDMSLGKLLTKTKYFKLMIKS